MEFYDLQAKKRVTVPNKNVTYGRTKRGGWMAKATWKGRKYVKFVKASDVPKNDKV